MTKLWESKQHRADRAQITQDLNPGTGGSREGRSQLNEFLVPKKPRTWGDVGKDTVEVVRDAAYEGVIKDVLWRGARGLAVDLPTWAYRKARPAQSTATPPVVSMEAAAAAAVAAIDNAESGPSTGPEIEMAAPSARALVKSLSATKRPMRPMLGSFKEPAVSEGEAAAMAADPEQAAALQQQRRLYKTLSSHRSTSARYQATRFTDAEIAAAEESWLPARSKDISAQLKSGGSLDSNLPNAVGVVRAGSSTVHVGLAPERKGLLRRGDAGWQADIALPFELACDEPVMGQLLAALLRDVALPEHIDLSAPTTLALRLRGEDFQTAVADPVMALGKVEESTRADGSPVSIDEQVFSTIFDGLLRRGAAGVGPLAQVDGKPLYDFLADAKSVEFASTNAPLAAFLNERMHSDAPGIRDLRMRLALFEVAKLNYFENAEIKEATKEFLAGTIVGAVGELAIEFIPSVNKKANFDALTYVLNVLFGGGVDFIDNAKGRLGAVTMNAAGASEAAIKQQRSAAIMASACGAAYGTLANFAAQYPISLHEVNVGWLIAGTAFSIVGSSLSIPFQMQADRARKTATVVGLLKEGIATLPPETLASAMAEAGLPPAATDATPASEHARLAMALRGRAGGDVEAGIVPWQASKVVRDWADQQAVADMSMSLSSTSSTAGFMVAPLLSSLWVLNLVSPHARTALQSVIFGVSPGAENLSTAMAAATMSGRAQRLMNGAASNAIAAAVKGDERPELDAEAHEQQASATLGAVSRGLTAGLSAFGNINVLKQKTLL